MKKVNPKVLYLASTGFILVSIFFKESSPMTYYTLIMCGVAAFLWAATATFRG